MSRNSIITIIMISMLLVTMVILPAGAKEFVGISTASTGGTFYPVGVAIATILDESLADETGYKFSAHTSGGTMANLEMMRNKEIKMAIVGGVPTCQAYMGVGKYEGKPIKNVRFLTALYPEVVQFVYRADSGIETLKDFAGRKVAVGTPGGGGSFYTPTIFKTVADITFDNFKPQYLGYGDSAQAMQDNLIDAAYLGASYPTSAVSQLYASPLDVKMIEFTDEEVQKLKDVAPYYARIIVPKGSYPGQEEDLKLVGFKSAVIVEEDVDAELVYEMLKVIYLEKLDELKKRQNALEVLSVEEAINGLSGAPLHAGAVKFYREQGLEIADELIPPEMK